MTLYADHYARVVAEHKCPAGYICKGCGQITCQPCGIGQPDCPHAGDLCSECRGACGRCGE